MVAVATSTVLRGSLRSAFNGSGEIVQRGKPGRQSRRVICSVDPVGHIVGPDVDGCPPMASTTSESTADFPRGRRVRVRQDQSVGPAGTRIEAVSYTHLRAHETDS